MLFGAHVSAAGGFSNAFTRGKDIGATSIQVFTQSPRAWKPSQLNGQDLEAFHSKMATQSKSNQILALYCHATYLINLASPEKDLYNNSVKCLVENLKVANALGASGLIVHVGSHRGSGLEKARKQIAKALKTAFGLVPGEVPILLENTAGAGDTVGRSLEELAMLLGDISDKERTGVCIDTQHLFASGVSFSSKENVESFVQSVENTVGLSAIKCFHLNDSAVPIGSNRDRHANLGAGEIGKLQLAHLVGYKKFSSHHAILEVPGPHGKGPELPDIKMARSIAKLGEKIWS